MQGTPGGQEQAAPGDAAPQAVQQQAAAAAPANGASPSAPSWAQSPLNAGQNMQQTGPQVDLQSWAMAQAQMLAKLPLEQQQLALQTSLSRTDLASARWHPSQVFLSTRA